MQITIKFDDEQLDDIHKFIMGLIPSMLEKEMRKRMKAIK